MERFTEYQAMAAMTANVSLDYKTRLAVAALGASGEAGEVADLVKKHLGHEHPLPESEMRKEIGDVLWYLAELCTVNGWLLVDIAEENIKKLRERFPGGFDPDRSLNRKEQPKNAT